METTRQEIRTDEATNNQNMESPKRDRSEIYNGHGIRGTAAGLEKPGSDPGEVQPRRKNWRGNTAEGIR